jgi:[ribosomal protein S5]-alanine N-acetyltransferase
MLHNEVVTTLETTLTTERLSLSPAIESDAEFLHQLLTEVQVRRYLCDDEIFPWQRVQEMVEESMAAFRDRRYGLWMAKWGDRTIGFTGFWKFPHPPEIQLIYALAPEFWGQGFATEMAEAMVEYGFQVYGFESIDTYIDLPNQASIAVAERLGMTLVAQTAIEGREQVLYQRLNHQTPPSATLFSHRP